MQLSPQIKKTELIQYLHGWCSRTTPRTCKKDIKNGNLIMWTRINNTQLLKHILKSIATALGHLGQEQNNLQLTKPVKTELDIQEDKYFYPIMESVKKHKVCTTIIPFNTKRKASVTSQEPYLKNQSVETYMSWSCMNLIAMQYYLNQIKTGMQKLSVMNLSKCTRY